MDNDEDQVYRESMRGSFTEEWDSFNERGRMESLADNNIENKQ